MSATTVLEPPAPLRRRTHPGKVFVSIGRGGKILRLPHDGTIRVNGGGKEIIYSEGGRIQHRTARRCVWCGSAYYVFGDASLIDAMFYCPACRPTRVAFVHSSRDAARPRYRLLREAVRERRPPAECRHCGAGISLTLRTMGGLRSRYCSAECKLAGGRVPRDKRKRATGDPANHKHEKSRRAYAERMASRRKAPPRICPHCSGTVPIEADGHQKYCSAACRVAYTEARRRLPRLEAKRAAAAAKRAAAPPRNCRTCKRALPPNSYGNKHYCSKQCRPSSSREYQNKYRRGSRLEVRALHAAAVAAAGGFDMVVPGP